MTIGSDPQHLGTQRARIVGNGVTAIARPREHEVALKPEKHHEHDSYPTVTVRGGIFKKMPGGILLALPTENDVNLDDAKEMIAAMRRLMENETFRLLLDQRGVKRRIDGPARKYLSQQSPMFDRMAIVTQNAFSKFFASGILMLIGFDERARSFDSYSAALAWLQEP